MRNDILNRSENGTSDIMCLLSSAPRSPTITMAIELGIKVENPSLGPTSSWVHTSGYFGFALDQCMQ